MRYIEQKINCLCKAGFFISCIALPVLVVTVFIGTMSRAFNIQILGVFEISSVLVGIMVFLGFGYVLMKGQHIVVRVITEHLPIKAGSVLHLIMTIISLVWVVALFVGCCNAWWYFLSKKIMLGALINIPMWIPALSMIIGIGLLLLQSFCEIGKSITLVRNQKQEIIASIQDRL